MVVERSARAIRGTWNKVERAAALIVALGTIALAAGYLLSFVQWGQTGPFQALVAQLPLIWSITASAGIVLLWVWVATLRSRFPSGFKDDFANADPRVGWDYEGPWRVDDHKLIVTGSDAGGLTKRGALWENYTFAFEAKIINGCIGVVVRARDLDNYYMMQINEEGIRPHRRIAVPTIQVPLPRVTVDESKTVVAEYAAAWQIFDDLARPLPHKLDGWFRVRIRVRGEALWMYVDDDLVWQAESFLKNPVGKAGFRNDGAELAYVRSVRVTLDV